MNNWIVWKYDTTGRTLYRAETRSGLFYWSLLKKDAYRMTMHEAVRHAADYMIDNPGSQVNACLSGKEPK